MRRYKRFGRGAKPRAQWGFSGNGNFQVLDGGTTTWNDVPLMPPARVNWVCDTDRVDSITYYGSLLWLDFEWVYTGSSVVNIPDIELFVIKSDVDPAGQGGFQFTPFQEPSLPTAVTSWDAAPTADGLDPFLWTHFLKGQSPPNAVVQTAVGQNESHFLGNNSTGTYRMSRTFKVAAEWQPDVHIKTRRRLMRTDGIFLCMKTLGTNTGVTGSLNFRHRTLYSRGR